MNNIKITGTKVITDAIKNACEPYDKETRQTVFSENLGKHIFELQKILSFAEQNSGICDVGGGAGVNLLTLRNLGLKELELYLVDRFTEYSECNRMGSADVILNALEAENIKVVKQDFYQEKALRLESGYFDIVTLFDVTEHFPGHPLKLLREIHRILKPSGKIIIAGPNSVSLEKRLRMLLGRHPSIPFDTWLNDKYYSHFREYDRKEQAKLLKKSGFANIKTYMLNEPFKTQVSNKFYIYKRPAFSKIIFYLFILYIACSVFPVLRPTVYCIGEKVK